MKIVKINKYEKVIILVPEVLDDLWHLMQIIEKGDIAQGSTTRKIKGNEGQEDRRVKLYLELQIEKADFDKHSNLLRIQGIVLAGKPEDLAPKQSHHSLEIELGQALTLQKKEIKNYQIERLKKAVEAVHKESKLAILIDDEQAEFYEIKEFKTEHKLTIKSGKTGKHFAEEEWQKKYFSEIETKIKTMNPKILIISGPGFEKEDLHKLLEKSFVGKIYREGISSLGVTGLEELMQSKSMQSILKETEQAVETQLMDRTLKELGNQTGLVTYGLQEVKTALNLGAIDFLLIADKTLIENKTEIEEIMNQCEKRNGKVHIFNTENEPGKKLLGLGGMVAILRYRVE
ncbi:MAG: mRNA surveillance protein pelota, partial [Candidatus Diapherotrites archaeon]|nr:mRNA surveillance protein pelota [Candidatus Diapherotrites archaeon]